MSTVEPFEQFLNRTRNARPEDHAEAIRLSAARSGRTEEEVAREFQQMKDYVLRHYEGVHPLGSVLATDGEIVDCVPVEQQPAARAARAAGLAPVGVAPLPTGRLQSAESRARITRAQSLVPHGAVCPSGSIPLVRLTLEHLIPFGALESFFKKHPAWHGDGTST